MISVLLATVEDKEYINAVRAIFNLYYARMKKRAFEILGNMQDAEDAAMNVMFKISRAPEEFVNYRSSDTVYKIICMIKNEAIDIYRKNQLRDANIIFEEDLDGFEDRSYDSNIEELLIRRENRELLLKAIGALSEQKRIPIVLKYACNMRNADIARLLGERSDTVNNRIRSGKAFIKKFLEEKGYKS